MKSRAALFQFFNEKQNSVHNMHTFETPIESNMRRAYILKTRNKLPRRSALHPTTTRLPYCTCSNNATLLYSRTSLPANGFSPVSVLYVFWTYLGSWKKKNLKKTDFFPDPSNTILSDSTPTQSHRVEVC